MKSQNDVGSLVISQKLKGIMFSFMTIGLIVFAVGLVTDKERIWQSFLLNFWSFMSISIGGLFFVAVQYASKAGWSTTVRRVAESFSAFLPYAFVAAVVFLAFGSHGMYEWLHHDVVVKDELLRHKVPYLNMTFWSIRVVLFFAIWIVFKKLIVGNSLKQDTSGDENLTIKNLKLSCGFLIVFALTYSLLSVDFLMSLAPHWFSTMFGVYCFSGLFQSTLAFIIIVTIKLMDTGLVKDYINVEHLHDLGKFLFAFTVFYAYIAFSQFMLIWYANLPEETVFWAARAQHGWMVVSYSLLVLKFAVPFLILLPRQAKRDPKTLMLVSILTIVMQWVDNYWLIYPNFNDGHVVFSYQEVGLFLGFFGLFIFSISRFLSQNKLVAVKDPYIQEAIHHHVS